jgi:hypothetical protein
MDSEREIDDRNYSTHQTSAHRRGTGINQGKVFRTQHMVIESPRETPLGSRTSSKQPATITRETNVRSDRSSSLVRDPDLSETQQLSSRTGAMVLRKKEPETRPGFHNYGDGNRETYEAGSSISFSHTGQSDRRDLSTNIYRLREYLLAVVMLFANVVGSIIEMFVLQ